MLPQLSLHGASCLGGVSVPAHTGRKGLPWLPEMLASRGLACFFLSFPQGNEASPGFVVNGFVPLFCVMMVPGSLHRALVASQGFHTGDL